MEEWAQYYADKNDKLQFLSLSVHPDIPKKFAAQMQNDTGIGNKCLNGYITRPPPYGQLGCSGYILLNERGDFISPKTTSFLDFRDLAYSHVQHLLQWIVSEERSADPPRLCPGEMVRIQGLQSNPEYNSLQAICTQQTDDGKYLAHIMKLRKQIKVSGDNLYNVSRKDDPSVNEGFSHSSCTLPRKQQGNPPNSTNNTCSSANTCSSSKVKSTTENAAPCTLEELHSIIDLKKLQSSTGHVEMDAEHMALYQGIYQLVEQNGSRQALENFYKITKAHFEHEEAEFKRCNFGSGRAEFSATRAHLLDHDRFLETLCEVLEEKNMERITPDFLREIISDFWRHIEMFDSKYKGAVCSA